LGQTMDHFENKPLGLSCHPYKKMALSHADEEVLESVIDVTFLRNSLVLSRSSGIVWNARKTSQNQGDASFHEYL